MCNTILTILAPLIMLLLVIVFGWILILITQSENAERNATVMAIVLFVICYAFYLFTVV